MSGRQNRHSPQVLMDSKDLEYENQSDIHETRPLQKKEPGKLLATGRYPVTLTIQQGKGRISRWENLPPEEKWKITGTAYHCVE